MKKHIYQMKLNQGRLLRRSVQASFGRTKDIRLHICSDGILIVVSSLADINSQEILDGENDLFADAVRKALTIYAIRYGRFLNVTSAEIFVDGSRQQVFSRRISEPPLIYSLSQGLLKLPFGKAWRKAGIESTVARTARSSYDGRYTSLHALLAAKSDRYEIERFTYYWMAMNGLYSYLAKLAAPFLNKKALDAEFKQMAFLARCCGHEPCLDKNDNNLPRKHIRAILWHTAAVIKHIPAPEIDSFCTACFEEDYSNRYLSMIRNSLIIEGCDYRACSAFWLMLFLIPYKIRCDSFHAGKALPTFCYKDDAELKVLRVINRLLDRFLTDELTIWLNEDTEAEAKRQGELKQAIENPAYDKWRECQK